MTMTTLQRLDLLSALIQDVQRSDALDRLEGRHTAIAQDSWSRRWPAAMDVLVQATTEAELEAALVRADAIMTANPDGYLTRDEELALVTIAAQSYALGQVDSMESAQRSARQASPITGRVVQARITAALVERNQQEPGPVWPRLVRRQVDDNAIMNIWDNNLDTAMTVADRRAAAWLSRDNMFWIKTAWDQQLGGEIAKTARATILEAGRTKDVAKELKKRLGAKYNEPDHYWDVLANAAVVRGRSMGSVSGFNAAGVATFRFHAMMDEATSPICQSMNGTLFTIEQANAHVDAILDTSDPEEFKAVSPWLPASEVVGLSAEDLASKGVILPPLHGRCRSTVLAETFV